MSEELKQVIRDHDFILVLEVLLEIINIDYLDDSGLTENEIDQTKSDLIFLLYLCERGRVKFFDQETEPTNP